MTFAILIPFVALCGFAIGMVFQQSRVLDQPSSDANERFLIPPRTAFLFDGDDLVDATPSGESLLAAFRAFGSDKDNLIALCKNQYPKLSDVWSNLDSLGHETIEDSDTKSCKLEISKAGQLTSIQLLDGPNYRDQTIQEELLSDRLAELSEVLQKSPFLIWKERHEGDLIWANERYDQMLTQELDSYDRRDLLSARRLFPNLSQPARDCTAAAEGRHSFTSNSQEEHWYNIASFPVGENTIHYAADASREVKADRLQQSVLKSFVQIFAQLAIGFGIFDESRQLRTYNPALVDLTGLDPVFLSSQPTLSRLIEEMRRIDKTPVPKDYNDFRATIQKLEAAAEGTNYEDLWTLSDGQVIRVTGRPYQNGSIAFLMEDITKEVTMTRDYRTAVQAHQDIIDSLEEPVFLFSASEELIIQNESARKFLATSQSAKNQTLDDVVTAFQEKMLPGRQAASLKRFLLLSSNQSLLLTFANGHAFTVSRTSATDGHFFLKLTPRQRNIESLPRVAQREVIKTPQ